MEEYFKNVIKIIGEDPNRNGLKETPERAAKALEFLTSGYKQNIDDVVNGAIFESNMNELVVLKDIDFYSLCEHHMLPFFGKCHVGYLPQGKIVGTSKIARIVDCFAKRLQVQENLTMQIAENIFRIINAAGVGVVIEAQHLCMTMRGVEKQNSIFKTSMMLGKFKDNANTRSEFLSLISS